MEEEIKETNEENITAENVNDKQQELDELTDRYKRVFAEFENYKKRSAKERDFLYASVLSDIVTKDFSL